MKIVEFKISTNFEEKSLSILEWIFGSKGEKKINGFNIKYSKTQIIVPAGLMIKIVKENIDQTINHIKKYLKENKLQKLEKSY